MCIILKLVVCALLLFLCIGILTACCAPSNEGSENDESSGSYEWYIKIYMPDGCVEGPGTVMYMCTSGLILVEIDGIQYKVGSQNILVRKLPEP